MKLAVHALLVAAFIIPTIGWAQTPALLLLAKTVDEAIDAYQKSSSETPSSETLSSLTERIASMQEKLTEMGQANAAVSNAVSRETFAGHIFLPTKF
jgi:hypothetical protein